MSERLKSVGLDIGTTSTQMILSELTVENRASSFSVPRMEISQRRILYRSPVRFTPLLDAHRMDAQALRKIVEEEYRKAGIVREDVDTGAIIITGETSRKENAAAVLEALSHLAGDFVVAAAGPDLESVLAAKGAGAVEASQRTGKTVLHMDIGGGTSNLALIRDGEILRTGCLNVGGRLVKLTEAGTVTYVSPVLAGLWEHPLGKKASMGDLERLAGLLTEALEMAAGLRPPEGLLARLTTAETGRPWQPPEEAVILSFSGGVADCIRKQMPPLAYGDIGPILGSAIGKSRLCAGEYMLGKETIRATVIGAGCHSAQLSGSTVFHRNIRFPLKNLPVVPVSAVSDIGAVLCRQEEPVVLAIQEKKEPDYRRIREMARTIAAQARDPVLVCLEQDAAKALGQALALQLPREMPVLCIDRIQAAGGSYLDIAPPVGGAFPVVVKTLVLGS